MRRSGIVLALAALVASLMAVPVGADTTPEVAARQAVNRSAPGDEVRWAPGELLVRIRPTAARAAERDLHAGLGARVIDRVPGLGVDHVRLPGNVSVRKGLRLYSADPAVAVVEPNYFRRPLEHIPNDELFGAQWGLRNSGQLHPVTFWGTEASGTAGADISVTGAWDIQRGSPETIIAVLDDGVDIEHPDLAANIWTNPDEIPNNNVDDDDNGYIDDVHGWDFAHNDNTVDDVTHPGFESVVHGTHVAGIAAAAFDNDAGIAGVCPRCTIMPLKTDFTLAQLLEALDYARRMGADIVNGSYGGFPWSRFEYAAFRALGRADVLAVLAAGNDGSDNDVPRISRTRGKVGSFNRMYPASYGLPHIVSVAASDHHDEYASSTWCEQNGIPEWRCLFTNWGAESVDLAAPGTDVLSTVPDSPAYKPLDGTSMATPHVAGVAGLVKSQHPDYGALEIKNALMNSVDHPPGLEILERFRSGPQLGSFTRTNGRLNALKALDGDTREATEPTDGTIEGAGWIDHTRRGSIAWPEDPMDIFKKRLANARYRARLEVPAGGDYRLFVWAPGVKEIWQVEGGCYAFMPEPWYAQDGCKLIGWSDHRERGRDEVVKFRARRSGVHYFLVNPWLRSRGNYELNIVGVRSISIAPARSRVPRGRRTQMSGRIGHPDCLASQRVRLRSRVPGGTFRTIKKTWTDANGAYTFRGIRISRTKDYRTVAPRTTACTQAVSRAIRIKAL
jgi:subtilisin family serine protease